VTVATGSGSVVRLRLSGPEAGEGVTCSPADVQRILRALINRSARIRGTRFPLWLGLITAFILAAGAGVSGAVWVNHHHTAPSADPMPALTPMNCPPA